MEPRVTEVKVAVMIGGMVQLIKYEQRGDYEFRLERTYAVDMNESEADEFQSKLVKHLRTEAEPHADEEYQKLLDARAALNS